MPHKRLSEQQEYLLRQNELHGSDGNWLQSQKFQEERKTSIMTDFKEALQATKKRLKPYKVSLTTVTSKKGADPLIYLTWGYKFTPKFPDGSEHNSPTFKKSLEPLMKRQPLATIENLVLAEQAAMSFAATVRNGSFKWEDYYFWLPDHLQKEYEQKTRVKTIGELIAEFEQWFWAQRDKRDKEQVRKGKDSWKGHYYYPVFRHLQDKLDQPLTPLVIKEVIEYYPSNTCGRDNACMRFPTFLKNCSANIEFDFDQYKQSRKYKKKDKYVPSDKEIDNLMMNFPYKKKGKRVFQYRWVLGLMAVYGLRNHEALRIKNLHEPYTYIDKNGKEITLPAFMDKSVKEPVIFVEDGKTGERVQALPLLAEWIDKWGLRDFENPPTWDSLNGKFKSFRSNMNSHLRRGNSTFQPYSLRRAYAHRCERFGILPNTASTAMGHTLEMHTKVYHSHKSDQEKIELQQNILREIKEQEVIELSKDKRIEMLERKLEKALAENDKLRFEKEKAIQELVELRGLTRVK